MIIPVDRLSEDALTGLIEEFITREGTDYGDFEIGLVDKVKQVRSQLVNGDVLIIFDAATESINLMTLQQYREIGDTE